MDAPTSWSSAAAGSKCGRSLVALESLAVLAGVARRCADGGLVSPFVGEGFALAAVTTGYALAVDLPLAANAKINPLRYWRGANGAVSGRERRRCAKRRSDLSRYPMEWVRRLEQPTTLVLEDEVPRVPQRANFFVRAGLGELSRIGELALNPFVGPRFKSVVLTTDLPLVPDKPIDFGLQYFCSRCLKCARECPVSAIPFGGKVVFNGYEIWKPDVERCAYHAADMPPPGAAQAKPVNHRAAVERAKLIETLDAAVARRARGGEKPAHYVPPAHTAPQEAVAAD